MILTRRSSPLLVIYFLLGWIGGVALLPAVLPAVFMRGLIRGLLDYEEK